ncbi:efflux RND transporter periplasmic adaptor subunit [Brucepastera parasyntrophica]|uniref:efflux RND transporter periplasmic adaptor subunit n=1 Tax=Brucepastera parasyntrophica TaxID=2880008 RepID=UPI00210E0809|nr:efflux RND transporter periplasmic adaptor subunit [Brucepastera parasyntrophica]
MYARSESTAYAAIGDVVRHVNVNVGDHVEQDQVVLSLSADNQVYRQASLAWENAQKAYERNRLLYNNGDISRQNFDNITMQYELAGANYRAACDMINIKAPISGTITQLNVHPTSNVTAGTALFTVSGRNGYEACFYVGADEIDRIHSGSRVSIDLGRNNGGFSIEGRVTQVSLMMDSAKQAFPVTASFDMTNRKLAGGMGVDLAVETYRNEKAIVVSRSELTRTEEGFHAYIAQGNKAEAVAVEVGQVQGSKYEVVRGLEYGDMLIFDGRHELAFAGEKANTTGVALAFVNQE